MADLGTDPGKHLGGDAVVVPGGQADSAVDHPPIMTDAEISALTEVMANILVVNDLLDDIIREADSHTPEQAVALHDTIGQVIKRAKEAQAALAVHLTDIMEVGDSGQIEYRGNAFAKRKKKEQERFDHDLILDLLRQSVVRDSVDENGVLEGPLRLLGVLTDRFRDVYLSDSSKAKIGELERYGIKCETNADGSVRTAKFVGYELKIIPLMKGDQ